MKVNYYNFHLIMLITVINSTSKHTIYFVCFTPTGAKFYPKIYCVFVLVVKISLLIPD